jgi:two-component system, chemotaxis family, protein-glutamate methylesterase/glutaminase
MGPPLVVVGASLGGFAALQTLLRGLPRGFGAALVIAQHRGRNDDEGLVKALQQASQLPVCEPEDKEPIAPGRVYLAPADYHLLVEPGHLALSTEAPVNFARPSLDVLFDTAAEAYGSGVICVVLTGANEDGARGAARVKQRGGLLVVQDPATAEASAMPSGALKAAPADRVLPLLEIAPFLVELCGREEAPSHG